MSVEDKLKKIKSECLGELGAVKTEAELIKVKADYLGRKGAVTLMLKDMASLSVEEKKATGKFTNILKKELEVIFENAVKDLSAKSEAAVGDKNTVDVTLPGRKPQRGTIHPVTQVTEEITDIFLGLGFTVSTGPEIETDYYNFEALNLPKDHPARDMQDTFYISENHVLRTHTSPVQIRAMENSKPPLRVIAPGTVYRKDSDVTHTPMFHQIEGFMVDDAITFGDLKGVLSLFLHRLFGEDTAVRFRPSFFPFTEPSAEVDIECVMCSGKGCRICKQTGWLEILGAGMIHPNVLKAVNVDPERYNGFAFGLGIERIAMLKHGIDDLRAFYENDLRFLKQF